MQKILYMVFIAYKKASDSIKHAKLSSVMKRCVYIQQQWKSSEDSTRISKLQSGLTQN